MWTLVTSILLVTGPSSSLAFICPVARLSGIHIYQSGLTICFLPYMLLQNAEASLIPYMWVTIKLSGIDIDKPEMTIAPCPASA